ncbi:PP0621 family protein [Halomonas halodenitrificans]|uniref:PP0621 family protein n=1 Tax=Halomonas halodenitrificans TaxID=28252 RepID=UPI000481D8B4|nr:PP0621 family protein [Halomonas halodenitrificans]
MNLLIIRLIIFAVLFLAGLKLYRMYREWKLGREELLEGDRDASGGNQMVRCAWCQVHVPENDAQRATGEWFCSSAHRDRYLQEQEQRDAQDSDDSGPRA